jgi:hypothetical protein
MAKPVFSHPIVMRSGPSGGAFVAMAASPPPDERAAAAALLQDVVDQLITMGLLSVAAGEALRAAITAVETR